MKKKKNKKNIHTGICRLCGKKKKLTFEHVPPKSTFNKDPMKCYDGNELIKRSTMNKDNLSKLHYKQNQNGSGGYYLCRDCNSFIGDKYNKEYSSFVNVLGKLMESKTEKDEFFYFGKKLSQPVAIIKQIMAMFCDKSDLCSNDKQLTHYILDEKCMDFNFNKYRIFCHAVDKGSIYSTQLSGEANHFQGFDKLSFSWISAYPMGFILFIDEEQTMLEHIDNIDFKSEAFDITNMAQNTKIQYFDFNLPIHKIIEKRPFFLRDGINIDAPECYGFQVQFQ